VSVLTLLDALDAAGLPVPIQDAVGVAIGDAPEVLLSAVKGLLTGAGVGVAAAMRIVGRLVSVWRFMVQAWTSMCDELFSYLPVGSLWLQGTPGGGNTVPSPAVEEARRRVEEDAAAAAAALARARELAEREAQLAEREARIAAEAEAVRKAAAEAEAARAAEAARKAEAEAEAARKADAARKAEAEAEAARKAAAEVEAARKAEAEAKAARRAVSCA
jgi:hypothetical protein